MAVAWLHDVLEDTKIRPEDLEIRGIPRKLVHCVELLTKRKNENYVDYIRCLVDIGHGIPVLVKLADLEHN